MNVQKNPPSSWLERIEDIIHVLEGSTIGEIELTEGETEIIIRRSPGLVLTASSTMLGTQTGEADARQADQSIPNTAPLTGVYYAATSPPAPPFVSVGEFDPVGQV